MAHKATVCVRFQGEKRDRGRTEVGLRNLSFTFDRRRSVGLRSRREGETIFSQGSNEEDGGRQERESERETKKHKRTDRVRV